MISNEDVEHCSYNMYFQNRPLRGIRNKRRSNAQWFCYNDIHFTYSNLQIKLVQTYIRASGDLCLYLYSPQSSVSYLLHKTYFSTSRGFKNGIKIEFGTVRKMPDHDVVDQNSTPIYRQPPTSRTQHTCCPGSNQTASQSK